MESISSILHAFLDKATATVKANPDFKAGFSYWIIGGTKRTDNPASFTMTYNNYAYAYVGLPVPRWLPLEDINLDGKISGYDLTLIARAYGSSVGDPKYDPVYDLNGDGKISGYDLTLIARAFGLGDEDPPTTISVTAPTQAKVQTMTASALNFASAAAVTMILSAFLKSIVRSLRR
jgi:hypothetical protein